MRVGDTIIARSSPPGRSARALVRISGPQAHAILRGALMPAPLGPRPLPVPAPDGNARCGAGRLLFRPGVSLPVLWALFFGPRSATGQDVAELLMPGNPWLVEGVIDRLINLDEGARRAEAGEFAARAFLNGRLDLVQAEGVARLIAARTESQRVAARHLLSGAAGKRYTAWSDRLAALLARTEAGIDFSDQDDVVAIAPRELLAATRALEAEIDAALASPGAQGAGLERARVVLVGPPNAGKSTLFNAILGRRRAVVSPVAGSTRDILAEPLDLSRDVVGGPVVDLCDAAGLAPDDAPDARAGRRAALGAIAGASVLVLCDPHARFDAIERAIPVADRPPVVLRVRTKADLPEGYPWGGLSVCALDGWGVGVLRRAIADAVAGGDGASQDVLPRHREALSRARSALQGVRERVDASARTLGSPEIVAAHLREALDAVGQVSGRTTTEDILGRVFASFCVGK